MWSEIYSPENDPDAPIINQKYYNQLGCLLDQAKSNNNPFGKVFCFSGHAGVGKTTILKRLCAEESIQYLQFAPEDAEFYDSNSNNFSLTEILENFLMRASLSKQNSRLVVIDGIEIPDNEYFKFIKILRKSKVLIAWILPSSLIKDPHIPFPIQYFNEPQYSGINKILKYISEKNQIDISTKDLMNIVRTSNGDIRTAINSLQFGNFIFTDFPSNFREIAAHIIKGDTREVNYKALEYVHGILPQSNEDFLGLVNSIEYFSVYDVFLEEEKQLQTSLALSLAGEMKKPRFSPVLSIEEQMCRNLKLIPPPELEEEELDEREIMELRESLELMEFDPIEEEENDF